MRILTALIFVLLCNTSYAQDTRVITYTPYENTYAMNDIANRVLEHDTTALSIVSDSYTEEGSGNIVITVYTDSITVKLRRHVDGAFASLLYSREPVE